MADWNMLIDWGAATEECLQNEELWSLEAQPQGLPQSWLPTDSIGDAVSEANLRHSRWIVDGEATIDTNLDSSGQAMASSSSFMSQYLNQDQYGGLISASQNEVARNGQTGPPFRCTVDGCDRCYAHLRTLQRHINTSHERNVKFPCKMPACVQKSVAFYRKDHLTQHMRSKHWKPRPRAHSAASISETGRGDVEDQFSELRAELKRLQDSVDELKRSRCAELEMSKEL